MYNKRISYDPKERVKVEGGMIRNHDRVKLKNSDVEEKAKADTSPIKVYKPARMNSGPISAKDRSFSFYDLIVSQDPEDKELRYNCFEDWVFPKILLVSDVNGLQYPVMVPVRTVRHGIIRTQTQSGLETQMMPGEVIQYAYILLNPAKGPVQGFGTRPGMKCSRMNYMVCVQVGDPRTGRLDNAFIQYALPLNTPVSQCCKLLTVERDPSSAKFDYYYGIEGDANLEKEIFDNWFNGRNHYFNSVLYPKIRGYMVDD